MGILLDLKTLIEYEDSEAVEDTLEVLSHDQISEIQKNIRNGAKDINQLWANALELVHKSYELSDVHRPTPNMAQMWTQYEENLAYAVQQLAKFRGMDSDWRMSSASMHEALQEQTSFQINVDGKNKRVDARSVDDIMNAFKKYKNEFDVKASNKGNITTLTFSKWGIKKKLKLDVTQQGK